MSITLVWCLFIFRREHEQDIKGPTKGMETRISRGYQKSAEKALRAFNGKGYKVLNGYESGGVRKRKRRSIQTKGMIE